MQSFESFAYQGNEGRPMDTAYREFKLGKRQKERGNLKVFQLEDVVIEATAKKAEKEPLMWHRKRRGG